MSGKWQAVELNPLKENVHIKFGLNRAHFPFELGVHVFAYMYNLNALTRAVNDIRLQREVEYEPHPNSCNIPISTVFSQLFFIDAVFIFIS